MKQNDRQNSSPQVTVAIDGTKIKAIRESKGLTQDYLATVVGVAIRTVSCWENNRSPNIKRENAESVALALEVSVEDIKKSESSPAHEVVADVQEIKKGDSAFFVEIKRMKGWQWPSIVAVVCILLFTGWHIFIGWPPPPPPGPNHPPPQPGGDSIETNGTDDVQAISIKAERYLPEHTPSGQPFPVIIKLTSSLASPISYIIKESLPSSCSVSKGSPAGFMQNATSSVIKWVRKANLEDESHFAYLARCDSPLDQQEQGEFSGAIILGQQKSDQVITGRNKITITDFHWADTNQDHRIDDNEILVLYNSFDILQELGVDIEEVRQAWMNAKGNHWNSTEKKFMILGKPCGQSWRTPLAEYNGVVQKVYTSTGSEDGKKELLLDLVSPTGSVLVHVFPQQCIDNTLGKFTLVQGKKMFNQGDRIRVIGSEFFGPQDGKNICAAEIISDYYTFTRNTKNELRNLTTGALNGEICRSGATGQEQASVSARYSQARGENISWNLTVRQTPPAVVMMIQNIPAGTTLLTSSPPYHSYDQETGTVKWLLTDLQPGTFPMSMELDIPIRKKGEISGELLFESTSEDSFFWLF
jgi:transcriptional regulator with XRE-family HTH domain